MNKENEPRAHPARNQNWEWTWMGFSAPEFCYNNDASVLMERYKKFKNCFDEYYGIGDFDYWISSELQKLSVEEKLELALLRLEDYNRELKPDTSQSRRKYIGVVDGKINESIWEFADARKHFWSKLTIEECRDNKWPHNQRCRHKNGYFCDDCGNFFEKDSEEFIRTEEFGGYGINLCNIGVYFHRAGLEKPQELIDLKEEHEELRKINPFELTMEQIFSMRDRIRVFEEKHSELIEREKNK